MKNLIYLFLAGALALASCSKDDPEPIAVGSVTLDKTTLTLAVGQQTTLTATVLPENADDKSVTWRSSAPTIATVSDAGVVTAIAAGSATITATAAGKSATCAVTVEPVAVESISLDKIELSLKPGASETLTATVLPENATDKTVAWSSDKPDVATVDESGVVTGVKPGSATITATAGEKSATCAVTVEPNVYAVGYLNEINYDNRKTYLWINGAANVLPFLDVRSVFVSEGDVYVAGTYRNDDGIITAGVWKNGTLTELPGRNCYAHSVFVTGGNVYVAGHAGANAVRLWENGVQKSFDTALGAAYTVFVSKGDVYVGGDRFVSAPANRQAVYWKNGLLIRLTGATLRSMIHSIVVAKGVVYAAGYGRSDEKGQFGVLWKGTVPTYLPEGKIAEDVKVSETGDVYVAGCCIDESPGLWKNGELTKLDGKGSAQGVFVYGNDVYVVGSEGGKAVLWKNGEKTELPGDANYAASVFVY